MEARPIVGDRVRAESGKELVVTSVTHATYLTGPSLNAVGTQERKPIIEVYLHKPELRV
jgi:hypothetical protein